MVEKRIAFTMRLPTDMHKKINALYPLDNCASQTEFIEKALRFYISYVASKDATEFLSKALLIPLEGIVEVSENRIRQNLFKLATEVGLNTRVISTYEGIDDLQLSRMRGGVIHDLKRTNGGLRLEDALRDRRWLTELTQQEDE